MIILFVNYDGAELIHSSHCVTMAIDVYLVINVKGAVCLHKHLSDDLHQLAPCLRRRLRLNEAVL